VKERKAIGRGLRERDTVLCVFLVDEGKNVSTFMRNRCLYWTIKANLILKFITWHRLRGTNLELTPFIFIGSALI
jgi:hypothetical protein